MSFHYIVDGFTVLIVIAIWLHALWTEKRDRLEHMEARRALVDTVQEACTLRDESLARLKDQITVQDTIIRSLIDQIQLLNGYRKNHAIRLNAIEDHIAPPNVSDNGIELPERRRQILEPVVDILDIDDAWAARLGDDKTRTAAILELDATSFTEDEIETALADELPPKPGLVDAGRDCAARDVNLPVQPDSAAHVTKLVTPAEPVSVQDKPGVSGIDAFNVSFGVHAADDAESVREFARYWIGYAGVDYLLY